MVTITDFEIQWREEFARRLKARMEELEVSPTWLAEQSGVNQKTICVLLSGRHIPHATTLLRISRALAVYPAYLIDF